ncbi:acyl-CoA thioesterase [Geobacillus thermodenitrificans]|jgi:acyl-CoA thioester hydrolase|uniref:4-hydroxybenzoyl-CoA thioesterase n=2 Tax=Geobacillus thermodenitrificans TaxID=33940 RepID=A4IPJ4_GEOTN|nr:thioesterase family protein [Geobacillus thermodenitrificans]ABO67248.1 4-hydroxybenzoyl-CoA thioesterase [Geobacillus thermodenitrificans NG80-2]ARA99526.1 4-hydroxybenzoyl-CoA thioesterase [Geobacillus thermodenitrificans]MED3717289.1 thioesterase family protein [Geobacillus thermodenitrificans]MED3906762.1 thioesterase family protein [Geobacillus thermodenitrificans]PJW19246.1 acyl-CoA thioesterase [Geobacillus thermodenitrificans]
MKRNEFQVRVNFGDTDAAGIVYYPNYFKWFDIAGHQFFRSIGLSPAKLMKEQNIILPLLDVGCTFERPLYYDDIITIKTTVEEVSRKTIKLRHEVFREEVRTGHGFELRGWVKEENGRMFAVPIPDDVRQLLEEDGIGECAYINPLLNA